MDFKIKMPYIHNDNVICQEKEELYVLQTRIFKYPYKTYTLWQY